MNGVEKGDKGEPDWGIHDTRLWRFSERETCGGSGTRAFFLGTCAFWEIGALCFCRQPKCNSARVLRVHFADPQSMKLCERDVLRFLGRRVGEEVLGRCTVKSTSAKMKVAFSKFHRMLIRNRVGPAG